MLAARLDREGCRRILVPRQMTRWGICFIWGPLLAAGNPEGLDAIRGPPELFDVVDRADPEPWDRPDAEPDDAELAA